MVNPSVWLFLISIFLMIFGFGFKVNALGMVGAFIFGVYVVYWIVWIIIEMGEIWDFYDKLDNHKVLIPSISERKMSKKIVMYERKEDAEEDHEEHIDVEDIVDAPIDDEDWT